MIGGEIVENNQLMQVFSNDRFGSVRVVGRDGEPWFVAVDVCRALEISNVSDALKRLDDDEKMTLGSTEGHSGKRGGAQSTNIVNEPGLYALVLGSRKPEARQFKRWITHEVIPSIRKHGAYMTPETLERTLTDPDFIIELATRLKVEQEARAALEAEKQVNAPKVLFADSVETSNQSILVGQLAKQLRQNGVDIGQQRLFKRLRDDGYLCSARGERYNMPTQRAMEQGLFEIKERTISNPDGSVRITITPKITGKGQVVLTNKYLRELEPRKNLLQRLVGK